MIQHRACLESRCTPPSLFSKVPPPPLDTTQGTSSFRTWCSETFILVGEGYTRRHGSSESCTALGCNGSTTLVLVLVLTLLTLIPGTRVRALCVRTTSGARRLSTVPGAAGAAGADALYITTGHLIMPTKRIGYTIVGYGHTK